MVMVMVMAMAMEMEMEMEVEMEMEMEMETEGVPVEVVGFQGGFASRPIAALRSSLSSHCICRRASLATSGTSLA